VSEAIVPEADIQRAKLKGYLDPTPTEKEFSGNISVTNNSGFEVDTNSLQSHANLKAKEYGLTSDINITVNKSNSIGGSVSFGSPDKNGITKFTNNISINNDGSMSLSQMKAVVNHEATHLQQSQLNKMFLKKNDLNNWAIFWDGKEYMQMKDYTRLTNRMQSPNVSPKVRLKALKEYVKLPWEAEAHKNGDPFNSLLR